MFIQGEGNHRFVQRNREETQAAQLRHQDHQSQEPTQQGEQGHPHEPALQRRNGGRNAVGHQVGEVQVHRVLLQLQPLFVRIKESPVRTDYGNVQHLGQQGLEVEVLLGENGETQQKNQAERPRGEIQIRRKDLKLLLQKSENHHPTL